MAMTCFGELLLEARTRARLTQKELAMKVDVHDTYISKMETGAESPPSRKVALDLAAALGISGEEEKIEFLSAAGVLNAKDLEGFTLVKIKDGEAEEVDKDAGGKEPEGRWRVEARSSQRASTSSTRLDTPLPISHREILMRRLAVLEKMLHDANEELREIGALVAYIQDQE
jgi:transcriptional regulator with XRE-family HTH domain